MSAFDNTPPNMLATLRFVIGTIERERQRLATIFREHQMPELADKIVSSANDLEIFKWPDPQEPRRDTPAGPGEIPIDGTPG